MPQRASTSTGKKLIDDWELSSAQINAFADSFKKFGQDALVSLQERTLGLSNGILKDKVQAVYTARCVGIASALFSLMDGLPDRSVVYILEIIREKTDELLERRRKDETADSA